jgi:hypothetical protein
LKIPKNLTEAKASANKQNGEKSTGPKSARGKEITKRNATRHAIFSQDILVKGESQLEFDELRQYAMNSYRPVGFDERSQVELIVIHTWRLRRLFRAEAGEIDSARADYNPRAELAASSHTPPYQQAGADLKKLEHIADEIESEGCISAQNLEWLRSLPYRDEVGFILDLVEVIQNRKNGNRKAADPSAENAVQRQEDDTSAATDAEEKDLFRELVPQALDKLKNIIQIQQVHDGEFIASKISAQNNKLLIPGEATLDRLLGYEQKLTKRLSDAGHELERRQRLRLGDEVPPPTVRI